MAGRKTRKTTDKVATIQTAIQATSRAIEPADALTTRELEIFDQVVGDMSFEELDYSQTSNATILAQITVLYQDAQAELQRDGLTVKRPTGIVAHPNVATCDKLSTKILALKRAMGLSGSTSIKKPAENRERRKRLQAKAGKPRARMTEIPAGGSVDWTKVST